MNCVLTPVFGKFSNFNTWRICFKGQIAYGFLGVYSEINTVLKWCHVFIFFNIHHRWYLPKVSKTHVKLKHSVSQCINPLCTTIRRFFSRAILEPNLGQKSRVTALYSAIPNSNIYFLLNDCFHAVIFSQLGPH